MKYFSYLFQPFVSHWDWIFFILYRRRKEPTDSPCEGFSMLLVWERYTKHLKQSCGLWKICSSLYASGCRFRQVDDHMKQKEGTKIITLKAVVRVCGGDLFIYHSSAGWYSPSAVAERRFPVGAGIFECSHRCVLIGYFRPSSNESANQQWPPLPPVLRYSSGEKSMRIFLDPQQECLLISPLLHLISKHLLHHITWEIYSV